MGLAAVPLPRRPGSGRCRPTSFGIQTSLGSAPRASGVCSVPPATTRREERTRGRDPAMAGARGLLCLWLGCLCVSLARGGRLRQHPPELSKTLPRDRSAGGGPSPVLRPHDKVSEHMLRLYDRYSGGRTRAARAPGSPERSAQPLRPRALREGNTVRSFRAAGAAGECPLSPSAFWGPFPGLPRTHRSPYCALETFSHPPQLPSQPSCPPHPSFGQRGEPQV